VLLDFPCRAAIAAGVRAPTRAGTIYAGMVIGLDLCAFISVILFLKAISSRLQTSRVGSLGQPAPAVCLVKK
jgi:hypothetical protein